MSGRHGDALAATGPAPAWAVHADPAVKVAALVGFVLAVVATPRDAWWAFAADALLLAVAALAVRIPPATLARRLAVDAPFVVFAVALPFIGTDPRTEVGPLSLSVPGLWAAWGILAKAGLATSAAVLLGWTTPAAEVLVGLERLRVPRPLVAIAGFMVRYLDVVAGELRRLEVARLSRGDDPRWLWQGRAVAGTAGTLFVRSYERGERVAHAMAARGFTGTMPPTAAPRRPGAATWPVVVVPVLALATTAAALVVAR